MDMVDGLKACLRLVVEDMLSYLYGNNINWTIAGNRLWEPLELSVALMKIMILLLLIQVVTGNFHNTLVLYLNFQGVQFSSGFTDPN